MRPPDHFLEQVVAEALKVPAHVWRETLRGLLADRSDPELAAVRCPSLLLWGDADPLLSREDQEDLVDAIPGGRLVVYPGAGHAPYWEQPARVAADLVVFLEGRERLIATPAADGTPSGARRAGLARSPPCRS